MKHERATEEVRELAALYALGTLTQHEARSFEIHLREGCPVCAAELRRFERATAKMGFAVEEAEAPEYVRDLLVARIEREAQTAEETRSRGIEKPAPATAAILSHQAAPFSARPERRRSSWLAWTLVVAFALAAMFSFYSWKSSQETAGRLQSRVSTAQADIDMLKQKLDLQQSQSGNLEQIVDMAGKQGIRVARLKGQPATPGDTGTVFLDAERGRCMIVGAFAPPLQGKGYQLWLSTASEKISIGTLPVDANGHIFATLALPQNAGAATGIIVTIEPAQGSPTPTGPFCATGHID